MLWSRSKPPVFNWWHLNSDDDSADGATTCAWDTYCTQEDDRLDVYNSSTIGGPSSTCCVLTP